MRPAATTCTDWVESRFLILGNRAGFTTAERAKRGAFKRDGFPTLAVERAKQFHEATATGDILMTIHLVQ